MIKMDKNILEFRKMAREKVGNIESEMFDVELGYQIERYKIESPIEQLLYTALHSVARTEFISEADVAEIQGIKYLLGINILPQFEIGKYRVDFKVSYFEKVDKEQKEKTVLVECDSQQFHDRSEPERRYEKKRDRDIQKMGYKIFRFTGSEIVKNPFNIAAEVISHVTNRPVEDIICAVENY